MRRSVIILCAWSWAFTSVGCKPLSRSGDASVVLDGGDASVFSNRFGTERAIDCDLGCRWVVKGTLQTPRVEHGAVLLDDNRLLVVGGRDQNSVLSSTEIIDLNTGISVAGPTLVEARKGHHAIRLDKRHVLVIGGEGGANLPLASCELLEIEKNQWQKADEMGIARVDYGLSLDPAGNVWVSGGASTSGITATIEYFDIEAMAWNAGRPLRQAHTRHASVWFDDAHWVIGGQVDTEVSNVSTFVESVNQQQLVVRNALPKPVAGARAVVLDDQGSVYLLGGIDDQGRAFSAVWKLSTASGAWSQAGELNVARVDHQVALDTLGYIWIVGGASKVTERWDPRSQLSQQGPQLNYERSGHTLSIDPQGRVWMLGGVSGYGKFVSEIEVLTR